MGRKLAVLLMGAFLVAAAAPTVHAEMCGCEGMGGKRMQAGGMMGMMGGMMMGGGSCWDHLASLNLDDKQKESLKAIRSRTMKEMAKKMADKQIAGIDLRDLLDKDPVDLKAVETAVKKKEALSAEMFLTHVKAHEEVKALLTADQKKKLKELMSGKHCEGCVMMGGEGEHNEPKGPMHEHMHGQ